MATRDISDDGACVVCGVTGYVLDTAGLCHACWQEERERQDACVSGMTTPDECAMARERATAGLGIPGMEPCPDEDETR